MTKFENQVLATRVLIKFCEDHEYNTSMMTNLESCLKALQRNEIERAIKAYQSVPLGGMGCFNDRIPQPKFKNETSQSVDDLFIVLTSYWSLSMKILMKTDVQKSS
jgi:hypothetical protein